MIHNIPLEALDEILRLGAKSMIAHQRNYPEGYRLQLSYLIWLWFENNASEYVQNAANEYDSQNSKISGEYFSFFNAFLRTSKLFCILPLILYSSAKNTYIFGLAKFNFIASFIVLISALSATAQKYAYVDSDYILSNIPEYKSAQAQVDNLSVQWQKEIEVKYSEIDKLYKAFQAEQILLTEDMKKKRETEIITKEKEVKELQKSKFGVDGELFKKRQDLVKPIQDKVYNAIKDMAVKGTYAVVFDKASGTTMLYTNPKYDKSDLILTNMGYKKGSTK
jgi:outer membrane protein